jgi:hypothetical protein
MTLSAGAYLAGVAELAGLAVALAFGAYRLRARLLPEWPSAPARLAEAILALAAFLLISQALGLVGLLSEWPLVIACIATGLAAAFWASRERGAGVGDPAMRAGDRAARQTGAGVGSPARRAGDLAVPSEDTESSLQGARAQGRAPGDGPLTNGSLQLAVAIAVTAVLFAIWAFPTLESLGRGMYGFDTQWYHMPFSARFAETGEIWPFHYTTPVYLSWFYPANSELLHTGGILLFDRDILSPLINLGWMALALLAAWCLGRPWGVPGWSVLGAGVVLAGGVFADQPGDARNDIMALALILSSGALLANAREVRAGPALAIAALAAGLALGTRLTALVPIVVLSVGVIALASRGSRWRAALLWLVPLLAAGGIWYLRNLVGAGNPLPWFDELGPLSLPGPDQELGGRDPFSVAHYASDFEVWGEWFAPGLRDTLGLLWPAVLALGVVGAALALVRGPSRIVRLLGVVAIVGAIAYLFTPVTASGPEGEPIGFESNLRYLTAPLALALALVPVALRTRSVRLQWLGAGGLGIAFIAAAADPDRWSEGYLLGALAAGLGAGAVIVLSSLGARIRPWAPAAGLAALAVLTIAAGYPVQRQYLEDRYAEPEEVLSDSTGLPEVFKWGRDVEDSRVGTITTRQYPLYGTDLSNHVQFVGLERDSAGFIRAGNCTRWREAVNAGGYDFLVVAFDRGEETALHPPEFGWTTNDPSARVVAEDGSAAVFALDGELDPEGCR